jgi:hypothetical protein
VLVLKCQIAFGAGSSGLDASPKGLKLQSPFGSSGLERIGFEPCGHEVSLSIWLERARAKGQAREAQTKHIIFGSQHGTFFETGFG